MTQEKLKRVVTAAAVAGTLVVVCLLAVILYQVIKIVVLNNRIDKVEDSIEYYEKQLSENENNLAHYESEFYLEQAAREHGFIYPGDKVGKL